jgi:hypothetical protein
LRHGAQRSMNKVDGRKSINEFYFGIHLKRS